MKARQPEQTLVTQLERAGHPELARVRTSLAVGAYRLGHLDLAQASEIAGVSSEGFERLVTQAAAVTVASERPMLTVVVPVLDEQDNLAALHAQLTDVLATVGTYEIVFVDDGSTDRSAEIVLELRAGDPRVRLVRLSRNFGHQAALSAGLDHAEGRAVIFMDADLQDPPGLITALVAQWEAGHEVVYAIRQRRKEGVFKRAGYFAFYRLFHRLAEMEIPLDAGDFCLIDRRVADVIRALPEHHRFLRGLRSWAGFRQVGVAYDRPARNAGAPKYTMRRLVKLAVDGLLAFSSVPLRLASYLGFFTALAGIAYIAFAVLARFFVGHIPAGWTSIIAVVLTVGGAQLMLTGLLGEYLARVYDETKGRPLYVVDETHGPGPGGTPRPEN
jgi:dolichol-phosphate mannosyltransferase